MFRSIRAVAQATLPVALIAVAWSIHAAGQAPVATVPAAAIVPATHESSNSDPAEGHRYLARRSPSGVALVNPRQHLQARFSPSGVAVSTGTVASTAQSVRLSLTGFGYGEDLVTAAPAEVSATGSRVELSRRDASGQPVVVEWYENRPSGLEQGFSIGRRPAGGEQRGALRVVMAVAGNLHPEVEADGEAVVFVSADAMTRLRYDHLLVTDSTGQRLDSRFSLEQGALVVQVADARATYPITIDPTFSQEAYIKASNAGALDDFGGAVAASGDTLVIGADGEDSEATTVNGNQTVNHASSAGAAYVFVRNSGGTWSQQAYLKPSNGAASDSFGWAVAISGDIVVVGAPGEDSAATGVNGNQADNSASGAGAAYVFVRSGTTWTQQAYLKASNAGSGDAFGSVVAVDGDTLLVGAANEDSAATGVNGAQGDNGASGSGAAYVFVRSGAVWTQEAYLKASNTGAGDSFGSSVSLSGQTAVIGAPAEDSVATGVGGLQSDNTAVDAGAAYVFVRSAGVWGQQAYLKASNAGAGDDFGRAVAVSGHTIAVGADQEDGGATGVNGNQALGPVDASGAVYVFVRSLDVWTQQAYVKASNTGVGDQFGITLGLSGDTLVVGAPAEDSAAVGINGDGTSNALAESGAAYIFQRGVGAWSQRYYVKASNAGTSDLFGAAVAIAGDIVVIGAGGEDSAATGINTGQTNNGAQGAGAAYAIVRPPNQAPTALAGSDRTYTLAAGLTTTSVTLDGSSSFDPNNDPIAFQWQTGSGQVIASSATVTRTLGVGVHSFTLTVDDGNGGVSTDTLQVTVRGTPVLTWPTPPSGVYPVTLGATHLNATANVPGAFVYTPAAGSVPAVGAVALHVDFTPTDPNYDQASAETRLDVFAPPVAHAGLDHTVTTTSTSAPMLLDGTGSYDEAGFSLSYVWRNSANQIVGTTPTVALTLPIGAHSFTLTVNDGNGGSAMDGVTMTVRGTPALTWAPPSAMSAPATLTALQLSALANVTGALTFTPPLGTVLPVGTHTLRVDFAPDVPFYDAAFMTVPLTVSAKPQANAGADQEWHVTTPSTAVTLTGAGSTDANGLPLTYAWRNGAGALIGTTPVVSLTLPIGAHTFTLTVDNGVSGGTSVDTVVVAVRGIPALAWSAPPALPAPVTLGASQLSATASVPGTFTYTPGAGSVLAAGTHQLQVVFTPASPDYDVVSATVLLTAYEAAAPVTAQFSISRSGFRLEAATGRFLQTVVVQNTSTIPVAGPVSLVIDALPVNVTLFGAEGQTTCAAPLGSPFVTINAGTDGVLTPGERVTLTLAFVNPLRKGITYATRVLAGPGCR